jgi:glycosyltransferase involved in cell wall biosynthesis
MAERKATAQNTIPNHAFQVRGAHGEQTLKRRYKLLFLAHPFPPARAPACNRTWNIAKYLSRLGWDVTVVTLQASIRRNVDKHEEEEINLKLKQEGICRILTDHRWRWLLPESLNCWNRGLGWLLGGACRKIARHLAIDNGIGWVKAAEQACSTLTTSDVDVILATGSPFSAFSLAKRLSDRLGRPYVLDYRDPWTGNPHRALPIRQAVIRKEARLLADCAAATVVSPSWALAMDRRFGLKQKLHVVTNGYDPEELACIEPYDFGHCAIVYAGNFYPPKRVISPVMAALECLKKKMVGKDDEWYFHYYGDQEDHVREEAKRFGVIERIVLHGRIPRTQVLSALRGAGVAIVITMVHEDATIEDSGMVTGKIFEAIGIGVPVLLIAPTGSDAKAVIETVGLGRAFTGHDIGGISSFLAEVISGQAVKPRDSDVYSWTNISKKLDSVLRGVIKSTICP